MVAIEEEIPETHAANPSTEQNPEAIKEDEIQKEDDLRYLGFVYLATVQAIVHFSRIYSYARDNSGPLKARIVTIEDTGKTVLYPVYEKFREIPYDLLKSVDHKVEKTLSRLQSQIYSRYEPVVEECAVGTWKALNRRPLFKKMAQIVVPTAANLSEKYNGAVCHASDQGYSIAAFIPLVPTGKISKIFGNSLEE